MAELDESYLAAAALGEGARRDRARRRSSLLALCFLVCVAGWLLIPLLETLYPTFGSIVAPIDEHRTPSPFPSPGLLLGATGDFAAGMNRWFDDRTGLRDLFIRMKNQIDLSVFHTSRKVLVGKEGWLFDAADPGITMDRLDSPGLSAVENRFVALAQMLRAKGVRLVVVGYPDKSRIYPEKLPAGAPFIPPGGNYDKLRQFLAAQPSLMFIDAQTILENEKPLTTERLYLKTDSHVDEVGQVPIVKEIIARIAQAEGRPEIKWNENFKLEHAWNSAGGLGRFMSPLFPVLEYAPFYTGVYEIGGKEHDGVWNVPNANALNSADDGVGRSFDWEFRSNPELCPERLPGMVLFGNSFSDFYWNLGLHRYFCFIRRARDPFDGYQALKYRFDALVENMPAGTRYFIYQYYLPYLPGSAPPVEP